MSLSARSSGDRALASEAMCVGSIPAGRTITKFKPSSDFARRLFVLHGGVRGRFNVRNEKLYHHWFCSYVFV
jgi:hypothetical protein